MAKAKPSSQSERERESKPARHDKGQPDAEHDEKDRAATRQARQDKFDRIEAKAVLARDRAREVAANVASHAKEVADHAEEVAKTARELREHEAEAAAKKKSWW